MSAQSVRLPIVCAVAAAALPLAFAHPAPFVDWPNHLARVFIGAELVRGDPFWSRLYDLNPHLVPNSALDLGIGALHLAGLDLDVAASLFLVLSYIVFVVGFCRLSRAFGSLDATKPLLGSILFFTGPLMFGLVNYMLGLGVAFWLLAAWLGASVRGKYALAVVGTVGLLFVHLLAAAAWVLVAGCIDAPSLLAMLVAALRRGALPRSEQIVRRLSAVCAGAVFVAAVIASEAGSDSVVSAATSNVNYPGHGALGATLSWKASILLRLVGDHATGWMVAVTLAGFTAFALLAMRHARPRLQPGVILAIGALAALVLALPEAVGIGSLLDYRLALVPFLIGGAALRLSWRGRLARRAALASLLVVSLGRSAGFAHSFLHGQAVFRAFEAAVTALPPGSILLSGFGHGIEDIPEQAWWDPPTEHLAARAAEHGVFVPIVFAVGSQQPVVLKAAWRIWKRTWQLRTAAELATMTEDIRPLCAIAAEQKRRVAMFVAYPGRFLDSAVDPADMLADTPDFQLFNVCVVPRFAS